MSDEEQLQKEWRSIVINKLDSLDSEFKSMQGDVKSALSYARDVQDLKIRVIELEKKIEDHKKEIALKIKESGVLKEEFEPVKKLTYGAVTMVLLAIGAEIMSLIFRHN